MRVLERHKRHVMLLAPTGRAAKVFSANSQGHPAYTIHRKIYRHNPDASTGGYSLPVPAENKLRDAVFIVDEASMIGTADEHGSNLLDDLMTFVFSGDNCRLILVGDTAQLPPVGAERSPAMNPEVLRSMGLKVSTATLTETARQAADSGILFNATRLRKVMTAISRGAAGDTVPVPRLKPGSDVVVVEGPELPDVMMSAYDNSPAGPADTILITRSNRRATEYNAAIRAQVLYREEELTQGDMLIVSKNHYFPRRTNGVDFIANGDIVTVSKVYGTEVAFGHRFADVRIELPSPDDPEKPVSFDMKILLDSLADTAPMMSREQADAFYAALISDNGPYASLDPAARVWAARKNEYWNALNVKYAYAVTCHKAQGGQWANVFVDLAYIPEDALGLALYRWLYTAVTRARTKLFLIAPPEALVGN